MRQAPQYVKKKNSADNGINAVPLESNTNGVPLQQPKAHSVERSARLTALEKDYNQLVFLYVTPREKKRRLEVTV